MVYDLGYAPVKSARQARKAPIGYGISYSGEDEDVEKQNLPLYQRNELLDELSETGHSSVKALLDGIGYLGARTKELATFRDWGSNPSGQQVLEDYGLLPGRDWAGGFARPVAGFLADAVLDPTTYMSFGGSALGKAGTAAKAARILDDAPRALSRSLIRNGNSADDIGRIAKRTEGFFQNDFDKGLGELTDHDLYARPLVGRGRANKNQTLEELVDAQSDWGAGKSQKAIDDINEFLSKSGQTYNDIKGDTLGGDIGFGLNPFGDSSVAFNVPLLGGLTEGAANVANAARWSGPGRLAYSMFDKSVLGGVEAADQVIAKGFTKSDSMADEVAARKFSELERHLPDSAFSTEQGEAIRNALEGTVKFMDPVADASKIAAVRSALANKDTAKFISETRKVFDDYLMSGRKTGIGGGELSDKFGTGYFARHLDKDLFEKLTGKPAGSNQYTVMTGDQLARGKAYHVPGGTKTLQELSLDPQIAGMNRQLKTDRLATDYIYNKLNDIAQRTLGPSAPEYKRIHAKQLAKAFRNISQESIEKKMPIFGQHPTENIFRYMQGRERAMGRANVIYDLLGSTAKHQSAMDVLGGGHKSLPEMLKQLSLRTIVRDPKKLMMPLTNRPPLVEGAKQNMLDILQARGFPLATINDLKNVSVSSELGRRLNKIADFYHSPEAQSKFIKILENLTTLWKSSVLAFPARFVRDWYSGTFSNFIMLGNPNDVIMGSASAKYLTEGRWDLLDSMLRKLPRYRGIKSAIDRKNRHLSDLAISGINRGGRAADAGQAVAAKRSGEAMMDEFRPGSRPQTTLNYTVGNILSGRTPRPLSELPSAELLNVGNWKKSFSGTFDTIGKALSGEDMGEAINPVLRWSAKEGDLTDRINRLTGFYGLLNQGISPEQAAKMVKEAQVDYQSLTKFEKGIRMLVPFYAYQSRMLKHVVSELVEKPGGRYFQFGIRLPEHLSRGSGDEEGYVPERIADKYGIPLDELRKIPGISGLIDTVAPQREGMQTWLSDVDLPGIDQLNMIKVRKDMDGRVKPMASVFDTTMSFMEGSHPLIKLAGEALTGQDAVTGIKKEWGRSSLPVVAKNLGLIDANRDYRLASGLGILDAGLQFGLPFYSRGIQLARRATDPRIPTNTAALAQTALNAVSGVKIENIDDAEKTRDALAKIEEFIGDDPSVRPFASSYIPKEILPFVGERTQNFYQLQRQLNKEKRGRAKKEPTMYNPLYY